jgi:DNA primase
MSSSIIQILERVLGQSSSKSKGNHAFHCPFCKHTKQKLEIHPETQYWHCWVCGTKGKSLFTLLKRLAVKPSLLKELATYLPDSKNINLSELYDYEEEKEVCRLPQEYIPLWVSKEKNFLWKTCIQYLERRGVTAHDILKYRIGYCTEGRYKDMIIFPNYDKQGNLTYFTTRTFLTNNKTKFINPPYSRNIVGFEMQLNWNLPVILVESALDAIILKRNASPLYGTTLSKTLKMQILENQVKDLYIALDSDALKKSIKHAEYLMGFGVNVHFIELPEGQDPNSLGYKYMWKLIESASKLTDSQLFEFKIQQLL